MSSLDRYPFVEISSDKKVFEFISTGPKGEIRKVVQFDATPGHHVFILAFGNLNPDGSIDDLTTDDNKDRDKILATVASTVIDFTLLYPESYIFFAGSTKARTRLYRMAITVNFESLDKIFEIWGLNDRGHFEPFQHDESYDGFLIRRRKILYL